MHAMIHTRKVEAKRIFERSITTRKLRYLKYYLDGDSIAFTAVRECYLRLPMLKLDCIGHYHKPLESRMSKLKKNRARSESID